MRKLYLVIRSVVLWVASILHFFPACSLLVLLGIFVDPRKNDRPQRILFRNVLRVAGVGFEVRRASGFDPARASIFVCNHVNLFDAFVIYSAIPQFVRGWELESHFKVPAYGWMMKRFGNIPVPNSASLSDLKKLIRRTRAALDGGVSIIVFAEGSRTQDGRVAPFRRGVFNLLPQLGHPIVPMSIVGSFQFKRKGSWMLHPSKIVVHLHDTIETTGLRKQDATELRERVHRIVAAPVHQPLDRP